MASKKSGRWKVTTVKRAAPKASALSPSRYGRVMAETVYRGSSGRPVLGDLAQVKLTARGVRYRGAGSDLSPAQLASARRNLGLPALKRRAR